MSDHPERYRTVLLFGAPGSGKEMQAAALGQLPEFVYISDADVFRELPVQTALGQEIDRYTSQGLMVPDDLTVRIWERHIKILEMQQLLLPGQHTLVLDGLPRNHAQAERLDHILDVVQIFHLIITDTDRARDGLKARALRENRLDDMSEEFIRRQLKTYHDEIDQTVEFYPGGLVYEIDARESPLRVLYLVSNHLSQLQSTRPPSIPRPYQLYEAAIEIVIREGRGSTSLLQRAMGIGYGRAARLIDYMAEDGIVGQFKSGSAREVLYSWDEWEALKNGGDAPGTAA